MQRFVAYDGSIHPVRDGFPIFPPWWSEAEEAAMLRKWNQQGEAHKMLTEPRAVPLAPGHRALLEGLLRNPFSQRERDLLAAWTNRRNINSSLVWLQGVDYRAKGFATACQVHGNRNLRLCGCDFHYMIDHHRRHMPPAEQVQVPIRADAICDAHRGHNSLEAAFWGPLEDKTGIEWARINAQLLAQAA